MGKRVYYGVQIDTFVYLSMVREIVMRGAFLYFDNISNRVYLKATVNNLGKLKEE